MPFAGGTYAHYGPEYYIRTPGNATVSISDIVKFNDAENPNGVQSGTDWNLDPPHNFYFQYIAGHTNDSTC
jgi:hypothetical protein